MIKRTKEKVHPNSVHSINKMTKEAGVSCSTMFRICQEELNLIAYKHVQLQFLSEATKAKREERSCILLSCLKSGKSSSRTRSSSPLKPSTTAKMSKF